MAVSATQNKIFLFGLGLSTCLVINLMRRMLSVYRDAAINPPSEKNKSKYVNQEVEDSLKLGTLSKLLESPNYSIQEIASIIVCERALHDASTVQTLFQYITQPDYEVRQKGVRALRMAMNSSRAVKEIANPEFYMAVVKSLEYSITDYEHNDYNCAWDNWHLRDVSERGCLMMLDQCVRENGVGGLIKARFVDRWLAKEPWGDTESNQQLNFIEFLNKRHYQLQSICESLFYSPAGRKQLEEAKLVPVLHEQDLEVVDVRMFNGESTAGEEPEEGLFVESRRPRDQTVEEEHLRRRHREAMVLNDGTTPLGRDDIFERPR